LQGLTSSMATKRQKDDEEGEDVQANAPDRDAVEKALIHNCSQYDEKHRSQPTLQIRKFMEAMHHESVQQCQLSDAELRGFVAEADIDERDEIGYVEHIKSWVPILFELRKSRVYDNILSKDWGAGSEHLIDLSDYENKFPLLMGEGDNRRRPSMSRNMARRPSSSLRGGAPAPGSAHGRMSRASTKDGNVDAASLGKQLQKDRKNTKDKERPKSRDKKDKDKGRPASGQSMHRTNSSDSVGSHASVGSHVSGR